MSKLNGYFLVGIIQTQNEGVLMDTKVDNSIINNKVINEMIMTERTYNKALDLLQRAFHIEENVKNDPLLLKFKEITSILQNISDALLSHVEKAIDLSVSEEEHRAYRAQRTQLLKAFFHAYKPYVILFNQYLVESVNNQQRFESINLYLLTHSNKLDLGAHLIQPVQRGPRYAMLVAATKNKNEHLTEINKAEVEALESLIAGNLFAINDDLQPSKNNDEYWFGKITYTLLFGNPNQTSKVVPVPTQQKPVPIIVVDEQTNTPSKLRILARNLIWGTPKSEVETPALNEKPTEVTDKDEFEGFFLVNDEATRKADNNNDDESSSEFTI